MQRSQQIFSKRWRVCLIALLCCFLWGSAFPSVKIGYALFRIDAADTASQLLFAGVRFSLAGLLAILFACIGEKRFVWPKRSAWGMVLVLCLFQTVLQYFFFYIGMAHTSGVKGSIITASNTFFCDPDLQPAAASGSAHRQKDPRLHCRLCRRCRHQSDRQRLGRRRDPARRGLHTTCGRILCRVILAREAVFRAREPCCSERVSIPDRRRGACACGSRGRRDAAAGFSGGMGAHAVYGVDLLGRIFALEHAAQIQPRFHHHGLRFQQPGFRRTSVHASAEGGRSGFASALHHGAFAGMRRYLHRESKGDPPAIAGVGSTASAGHAAVDGKIRSRNERSVASCKKDDRSGDLFRRAETAHRLPADEAPSCVLRVVKRL